MNSAIGIKRKLNSGVENLSPQVIVRVSREIAALAKSPPDGIRYVAMEDEKISEIHVKMAGPDGTPYQGGIFRVKLVLSYDFPQSPPRGFFQTKIYHPNVSTKGEICVNTLKRDWTADVSIVHILQVIRCLLIVPFPESSLNDEAGKLFMESYTEYAERARLWTRVHALSMAEWDCDTIEGCSAENSCKDGPYMKSRAVEELSATSPAFSKQKKRCPTASPKSTVERVKERLKKNKQRGLKRL